MTYLVLRFSSIGNVAMTVPVVVTLAASHPQHTFIYVSQKKLAPMFSSVPNVHFVEADFQGRHSGIGGLKSLYRQIAEQWQVDAVLDLQHNWKTTLFSLQYSLRNIKVYALHTYLRQKKSIVRNGVKHAQWLPLEVWRYAEVFARVGMKWDGDFKPLAGQSQLCEKISRTYGEKTCKWLGIAPFAKYKSNMLPYRLTKEIIAYFASKNDVRVFLFGAGKIESEMLRQWATIFENVTCVAGNLQLDEEFELMRHLDLMLCMDSANQHLASLVGLRAVSIWGGTHPALGYYGWGQSSEDILQKDLPCRPCSINGTHECYRSDFACLQHEVSYIISAVENCLK